jgi:hypothetical protein
MSDRDKIARALMRVPLPKPRPRLQVEEPQAEEQLPATLETQLGNPELDQMLRYGRRWTPPGSFGVNPTAPSQAQLDADAGRLYRSLNAMANPEHFEQALRRMPVSENVEYGPPMSFAAEDALELALSNGTYQQPVPETPGWDWMRRLR